jgi:hypothetical protein
VNMKTFIIRMRNDLVIHVDALKGVTMDYIPNDSHLECVDVAIEVEVTE